ncbi:cell division protein ZipA C-terminal FtsZ-binding domain-containing protein [Hydrogenophaga sp. IBVHS2]|uniref:cell division protein ZipA C-terminal FtsZ-binding domain-containing protein n=1 Tax=Hydrogenophaga sp. IBVHS2 TaxID=1985170 RepID=UPI000A2D7656|nr:cell division protein ZipA C-terminal FtsZ-binding domain-containing protein [Hydrogenophaga sp. IBVHS2]OSZ67988.1 cell division protein FtsZ [Hydrogenophaga sp. IBVHS2]
MSNLQIGLAIIGGLVLAAVVAYNAWITRQNAPRTARERPAPLPVADAADPVADVGERLADPLAGRIDPVLDADLADTVPAALADALPDAAAPLRREPVAAERRPGLDALIDVIAPITPEAEVSGDAVLAALPATRRVGSKPFAVEGLSATGDWEPPRPGQRYRQLQAGVQLANRAGALNDIEFSEFVVKTQAFADVLSAAVEFPDMRAEVARARELDAFAGDHDAQLGFTLRARRAAWSPGYVAQNAARQGFVAGALPGRMVLAGSQAGQAPVLSLTFDPQAAMADDPEQSALREVTLSLEVTHVPRSEQPFVQLRQAARALAQAMDGVVTDDAGQPLSDEAMDRIGADLEALYDALDARDLSAGSPQARRLFS